MAGKIKYEKYINTRVIIVRVCRLVVVMVMDNEGGDVEVGVGWIVLAGGVVG